MSAHLCVIIASGKSDSSTVSACAGEEHRIFIPPKKTSEAQQRGQEREISVKKVQGQFLPLCLEEEAQGMAQVEAWGNTLPLHRTLRRRVWSLCYSAVAET